MNWLFFIMGMVAWHCVIMIAGRHIQNKRRKIAQQVMDAIIKSKDRLPTEDELPKGVTGLELEIMDQNGNTVKIGSPEYAQAIEELKKFRDKQNM